MPPVNMAIDMRHTKLKAEEAAILLGEVEKPGWASRNEGIHERVSFEDCIWGFDLAGGSYYKTPLRVTYVKPDSRAEKAGIRPGDRLKRINDIDTSTLTIQEAHEIILESGVHLRLAVTAPEDEEDAYYCYEDPLEENGYDSEEERRREAERQRKRHVHARVNHYWSLQWPWVSKRRIIYRESNCFMVPSKFEDKNKSKFPTQPMLRTQEDIVLQSTMSEKKIQNEKNNSILNGNASLNETQKNTPILNGSEHTNNVMVNGNAVEIPEIEEPSLSEEMSSMKEDLTEDISQNEESKEEVSQNEVSVSESNVESESAEPSSSNTESSRNEESESKAEESISLQNDNEKFDEMVGVDDSASKAEEENIIDSILSESEEQVNSQSDER